MTVTGPRPRVGLPARLLLAAVLLLLWVYAFRIASYPAKWEETRRSLVAMGMIHRGD